jgi:hypothetical protein
VRDIGGTDVAHSGVPVLAVLAGVVDAVESEPTVNYAVPGVATRSPWGDRALSVVSRKALSIRCARLLKAVCANYEAVIAVVHFPVAVVVN